MAPMLPSVFRRLTVVAMLVGASFGALAYLMRDSETYDATYGAS